jgi:hypothetical protein
MLAASFVWPKCSRGFSVPVDVASPMENVAFSLFKLNNEFQDYGLQLPTSVSLPNTLVLDAGAIGNGLVLLSQLPLHGRVLLMDKQNFRAEKLRHMYLAGFSRVDR